MFDAIGCCESTNESKMKKFSASPMLNALETSSYM